jgi:hypothetical protein
MFEEHLVFAQSWQKYGEQAFEKQKPRIKMADCINMATDFVLAKKSI